MHFIYFLVISEKSKHKENNFEIYCILKITKIEEQKINDKFNLNTLNNSSIS